MSRKEAEKKVNALCLEKLAEFDEAAKKQSYTANFTQLRYCKACYGEIGENFIVLQSYGTCVAFYDKRDNAVYDYLRYAYGYTATSAQHIAKFADDMGATRKFTYRH